MKKTILTTLITALALVTMAQVPTGFAAAYLFNQGSLANTDPSSAEDLSVLNKSGSYTNIANRKGTENQAIQMTMGGKLSSSQTSITNRRPLTVSYWIKIADKTSGSSRLLQFYGNYSGQGATGFRMDVAHTATETTLSWNAAMYKNGSFRGYANSTPVNNLDDDNWHHIVFRTTESGSDLNINVFIDNVQITGLDGTVTTPGGLGDFIRRNIFAIAPTGDYDGAIDDVRVYYSTLSDTDIALLYNETPPKPEIIYVDLNATGDNDGTTWADAFTSPGSAFSAASAGDQVWIAKGKYTATGTNRNASYLWTVDALSVYGGFAGSETDPSQRNLLVNETILSGDLGNDDDATNNSYCVLTGPYAQTSATAISSAYIDGLIIQDGYADAAANRFGRFGAGTLIESFVSKVEFVNCTWRNNTGVTAAGVGVYAEFSEKDISFTNCRFTNNKARSGAPFEGFTFGKNMSFQMFNCLIDNNETIEFNGAAGGYGHGGRLLSYNGGIMTGGFMNTTWANNKDNSNSTDKILLSLHRRFGSGQVYSILENCIMSDNDEMSNNFGMPVIASNYPANGVMVNNSLIDNITGINSSATLTDCITSSADFVNAATDNFQLKSTSKAIDAGTDVSAQLPAKDLAGKPRVYGTKIDLGCYENQGASASVKTTKAELVKVYPNPTHNQITVQTEKTVQSVEVLNMTGQTVLQSETKTVNISSLPKGIYIIKITQDSGIGAAKFIKE